MSESEDVMLQHKFANVNGIRMHYVTAGEGPLILFLHGFPEFWYSWRYQIPFFAKKHFEVVAPDMRGYGDTEKPNEISEYKIDKVVNDIIELIHSLSKERAIVVGHDWGGVISWFIAMSEPNVVEKLVIMDAPHPGLSLKKGLMNLTQLQRSWYIFFFLLQKVPEKILGANDFAFLKHVFESTINRKNSITQSDIEQYVSSWSKEGGLSGGINYYRANLGADFWENLGQSITYPRIMMPTLVIWGENDAFLGRELTENIGASIEAPYSLRFISNCGHWVQQEAPTEVNQIMKEFLSG